MAAWLTYLKERFPLPVYLLLSGGIATSGIYASGPGGSARALVLGTTGLLLFLALLRLMDEVKDYDKDKIAHPERPLPRGLLDKVRVKQVIRAGGAAMLLFCVLVWALTGPAAALFYLASTVFLWLMYVEFFLGSSLGKLPIVYAITHQVVMLPLVAFCATLDRPDAWQSSATWLSGACVLGSFFTYEICRKLDPNAPPILETYLVIHGRAATTVFVVGTSALAAWASWRLGSGILLWPAQGAVLLGVLGLFAAPSRFKIVEGIATLSLLLHLWSMTLRHFSGWPS